MACGGYYAKLCVRIAITCHFKIEKHFRHCPLLNEYFQAFVITNQNYINYVINSWYNIFFTRNNIK